MKKIYSVALLLLISISFAAKKMDVSTQENSLTAIYKGVTDEDYYKFVDDSKKEHLFYDVSEDVELGLEDDSLIGKKFTLTYSTKEIDEYDSEGEETGKKIIVKTILTIKEVK